MRFRVSLRGYIVLDLLDTISALELFNKLYLISLLLSVFLYSSYMFQCAVASAFSFVYSTQIHGLLCCQKCELVVMEMFRKCTLCVSW